MTIAQIQDDYGKVRATWFHMPYLTKTVSLGQTYIFPGRTVKKGGTLELVQPVVYTVEVYQKLMQLWQPQYPKCGVSNKLLISFVRECLEKKEFMQEFLPEWVRSTYFLAETNYALQHIHFPVDELSYQSARKRLVFDEFFFFMLSIEQLKGVRTQLKNHFHLVHRNQVDKAILLLPYQLTDGQKKALTEILEDLSKPYSMNRLVQGDVGSGKTILAILAMIYVAENGYQSALMAPTEVLARQHYELITTMFTQMGFSWPVELLVGSLTAKQKKETYKRIQNEPACLVIGTHALLQEKVLFDNLALVITDEQHRFGVRQRETLTNKGNGKEQEESPHVLVMSATPIPRTLAIVLYGDLDISIIDVLPTGRLPIKNCVVDPSYQQQSWHFIEKQLMAGRQAYVICPMVEESSDESFSDLENVQSYYTKLKDFFISQNQTYRVAYLHGKMKPKEKNQVMADFASGEIQVLISTTVIEVGVNVPNATVMMVENAERFGLAQLHQLRGRVGRGSYQSYCIFINHSDSKASKERLDILNHSNDGFYIASQDLKLRGPGDFYGVRQSGALEFDLGDIYTDVTLLKDASEAAGKIYKEDPNLNKKEHEELKSQFQKYQSKHIENVLL
jgi:ATP-dependent DNA helicase RecG